MGTDDPQIAAGPVGAIEAVVEVVREVAADEHATLDKPSLLHLLAGLDESARLLDLARSRVLAEVERSEAWRGEGRDASLAAWRSRTTRSGQGKAQRELSTARTLAQVPGATDALASGQLTAEHAKALARVAGSGGADRRSKIADALADPGRSSELLESAKHLDAPRFARAAQAWAARLDPLRIEKDHAAQRRARYLHLADTPSGTILKGQLDRMAGHRLRLALEAVTPVPSTDDARDPAQRAADALDTLAQGALSDPGSKPGGHVPPHVSLIMSAETLAGLRDLVDGEPSDIAPATLEDGLPVPPSETARILCDAAVTRIVLDAESVPVDLGRTKRLWSGPQRRLVISRDRHCAFPGCEIPPRWCEIHHIRWWARDGGLTDIANAVLLCAAHHGIVHAEDLTLRRTAAPPGPPGAGLPLVTYEITQRTPRPPRRTARRTGEHGAGTADPLPGQMDHQPPAEVVDSASTERPSVGRPSAGRPSVGRPSVGRPSAETANRRPVRPPSTRRAGSPTERPTDRGRTHHPGRATRQRASRVPRAPTGDSLF